QIRAAHGLLALVTGPGIPVAERSFLAFSLLPQIFHFGEGGLIRASAALRQGLLNRCKAPLEFLIVAAQCPRRIDAEMAGEIDDREQEIANFAGRCLCIPVRELCVDLTYFLTDLFKDCVRIVPVEADLSGLDLQLEGADQGGEGNRNARERAL